MFWILIPELFIFLLNSSVGNILKGEISHGCTVWMLKCFMLCIVNGYWKTYVLGTCHSSLHEAFDFVVIYFVTQQTLWHQVGSLFKMWLWLSETCRCRRIEPWTSRQIQTVGWKGFALLCQNLLQFLGLVGLSKGTVVLSWILLAILEMWLDVWLTFSIAHTVLFWFLNHLFTDGNAKPYHERQLLISFLYI